MENFFAPNGVGNKVVCMLFLLVASMNTLGQTTGLPIVKERLRKKMDLSVSNKTLKDIFKLISDSTGLHFVAASNQLDFSDLYSITVHDLTIEQILMELLGKQGFTWTPRDSIVTFARSGPLKPLPANGPAKRVYVVTGIVQSESGIRLPGATVRVNGTSQGTATDSIGHFTLYSNRENVVITTTYTGFTTVEKAVKGDDSVSIRLPFANMVLDETVIMAYGVTTRRTNTGSISKIGSADISRQPVINLLGALESRAPGFLVTPSSGVNGTSFSVQVRGRNSFANGSDPLYIIDGVPYISNKKINLLGSIAQQNNDRGGISPFNNLNKEDVASIEILKDADATAIYGSRGANGVVLITTRRGKEGKPTVFMRASFGLGTVPGLGDLLSKNQYMTMRTEAFANDELQPDNLPGSDGYAPDLKVWQQERNQDWQKMLIGGTARLTNLNMALEGGSKVLKYRVSGSLLKGTSVFPEDMPYLRGTGDAAVTYQSKNKRLSADVNVNYGKDKNVLFDGTLLGGLASPNTPGPRDGNGKLIWAENGASFDNPMADIEKKYVIKTANLLGSLNARYRIVDSLSFIVSAGWNRYRDNENSQFPIIARNPYTDSINTGRASFGSQELKSYIVEPQLEYIRTFSFGRISAIVGSSWQYGTVNNLLMNASDYLDDSKLGDLDAAPTKIIIGRDITKYKYAALFGRIIYNYKDRYILNFSARRDGSSRFGQDKRWSNFGSVGGAWLFSNEQFAVEHLDFLDYGKLRGSYGMTGNDQIGDYQYLDTWSSERTPRPYQGIYPIWPNALLNTSFSWERSKKIETALELGFLDNKLITTIAYFNNKNDRQIIPYKLASQSGFMSVIRNEDLVIRNTGWEFDLTADVLNSGKFNWRMTGNITFPKNRLVAFPDLRLYDFSTIYAVDYSLTVLKKLKNNGVDRQSGLYTFEDVNKDGSFDESDFQPKGNQDPKFYGGINNTLQWRNFRLDIFLSLRKQTVPNYFYAVFLQRMAPGVQANQAKWVLERWRHSGDVTDVQRYVTTNDVNGQTQSASIYQSDAVYENNFFVKVKNLSLSYSLDKKTVNKLKLHDLKFYLQGQNLFTLTNYKGLDPETPYYFSLPPLRIVTVGVDVLF
jgi:TonB-linked SusC/RagA family outer membrane protein